MALGSFVFFFLLFILDRPNDNSPYGGNQHGGSYPARYPYNNNNNRNMTDVAVLDIAKFEGTFMKFNENDRNETSTIRKRLIHPNVCR